MLKIKADETQRLTRVLSVTNSASASSTGLVIKNTATTGTARVQLDANTENIREADLDELQSICDRATPKRYDRADVNQKDRLGLPAARRRHRGDDVGRPEVPHIGRGSKLWRNPRSLRRGGVSHHAGVDDRSDLSAQRLGDDVKLRLALPRRCGGTCPAAQPKDAASHRL